MTAVLQKPERTGATDWQDGFLQMLPRIECQSRIAFRGLNPETLEDAVTEIVASTMCAYRRLHERGELERAFPSALTRYAIAQFRSGRRVGTPQRSGDLGSLQAKGEGGYVVCTLHTTAEDAADFLECLIDKRRTRVSDEVAFRLDLPEWLRRLSPRNRQIAQRLSVGDSTADVARQFRLSPGRVSQLRRQLAKSWNAFVNPVAEPAACVEA